MATAISIDAMGGDHAPVEVVKGAVRAAREMPDVSLLLVGVEDVVRRELDNADWSGSNIRVVPAAAVIEMGDSPVDALRRKRGSSIETGLGLVRAGEAQGFVSAGNTGACVAASTLLLRTLPGVKKAGILVTFSVSAKPVCIIDVGANVAAKPDHLVQYAIMASLYSSAVLGVDAPRVGLLNVGEESGKGNDLVRNTFELLQGSGLKFVGNVEGNDFYRDACDVVVCDGFTGNVVLKVSEGLAEQLLRMFSGAFSGGRDAGAAAGPGSPLGDALRQTVGHSMGALRQKLDYSEYGGAPLLGVDGLVMISHGRSDAKAIFNAVRATRRMAEVGLNQRIAERLKR